MTWQLLAVGLSVRSSKTSSSLSYFLVNKFFFWSNFVVSDQHLVVFKPEKHRVCQFDDGKTIKNTTKVKCEPKYIWKLFGYIDVGDELCWINIVDARLNKSQSNLMVKISYGWVGLKTAMVYGLLNQLCYAGKVYK